MACSSTGVNDRRLMQFSKIRLLESFGNQIAYFGVKSGNAELMDYIDLNCGAIPEGDFEQVIDLSAPHQFLSLYMGIAEKRFAFAVTEVCKMKENNLEVLKKSLYQAGKDLCVKGADTPEKAFEVLGNYVLDGMPCDETKEIQQKDESAIVWEKLMDTHEDAWKSAGGKLEDYYALQERFVNGLLEESGIKYSIEGGKIFTLSKK